MVKKVNKKGGGLLFSQKRLAQERTILANEQTTLAYVRTGLSAFVLGFALIKLFEESINYVYTGYVSLFLGVVFIIVGFISHPLRTKKILDY